MTRFSLVKYNALFFALVALPLVMLWRVIDQTADLQERLQDPVVIVALILAVSGVTWFFRIVQGAIEARLSSISKANRGLQEQRAALLRLATSKVLYSGDIDLAVRELTEIVASTLGVERTGVWLFNADMSKITCVCLYERSKQRHSSGREISASIAPRYFNAIRNHRVIVADDVLSNPLTNEFAFLSELGITSMLDAPIYVSGSLFGILCHEHVGPQRRWTVEEQNFAVSVADIVAMAFEVHERRKVEGELRRKSRAIEASLEGIAIIERDERFSFVNQAFARMFGYPDPFELVGCSWKQLYDQYQLKKLERHVFVSLRRAGNLQTEAVGTRTDGTLFSHEMSLTPLGDGGLVCVVRDISQRKEAELHLIENRRFLRKVIDTDPNFIFVKDRQGRFTLVNQAVADVYGAHVEDLIGRTDADFNPQSEEVAHFQTDDQFVIQSGKELKVSEEIITDVNGNTRILQTVKRPLRIPRTNEVHVLGVSTDITELKRLQNQLLQSQKMEALGQLAGGVAHDFNNMMTGILGYTALLKIECSDNPAVSRSADMIEKAATRAAELTQKLLGFARKGKHQNVPVDLHSVIKETVAIIARTVEKNIVIETDLKAENPYVMGDPVQVQQIILNLAINARDAMQVAAGGSNGGTLTLETSNGEESGSRNGASGDCSEKSALVVTVRDTGCGIPPQIKDKIFEPFFTTKSEGRGSGMGLAMVYGIVTNHGGLIEVQSVPNKGTTFSITLPVCAAPLPLTEQVEREITPLPDARNHTILVVDDHEVARQATCEMLQSLGYTVYTAIDGVDALEVFKKHVSEIDLVIIDLVMPRMGAKECLKLLRVAKPYVRVILSTGYVKNTSVEEILNDGSIGFLQKPYQFETLAKTVAQALNSQLSGAQLPVVLPSAAETARVGGDA